MTPSATGGAGPRLCEAAPDLEDAPDPDGPPRTPDRPTSTPDGREAVASLLNTAYLQREKTIFKKRPRGFDGLRGLHCFLGSFGQLLLLAGLDHLLHGFHVTLHRTQLGGV